MLWNPSSQAGFHLISLSEVIDQRDRQRVSRQESAGRSVILSQAEKMVRSRAYCGAQISVDESEPHY